MLRYLSFLFLFVSTFGINAQNGANNLISGGSVKTTPVTRELLGKTSTSEIKAFLDIGSGGSVNTTNFVAYNSLTIAKNGDGYTSVFFQEEDSKLMLAPAGEFVISGPTLIGSVLNVADNLFVYGYTELQTIGSKEHLILTDPSPSGGFSSPVISVHRLPYASNSSIKEETYLQDAYVFEEDETVLFTYSVESPGVYVFDITASAISTDSTWAGAFKKNLAILCNGSTASVIGTAANTLNVKNGADFQVNVGVNDTEKLMYVTVSNGSVEAFWHCIVKVSPNLN